jgi:PAS domain S-box-containing protein
MAKPIPPPEDARKRTTISLKAKVYRLAERYRELHKEEELDDFSAIVSRAILSFVLNRYPDLLEKVSQEIREEAAKITAPAPSAKSQASDEGRGRVETDHERRVVAVNDAFVSMCGHSREYLMGKRLSEVLQGPFTEPEVVEVVRKALDARRGISVEITNHNAHGDGYRVRLSIAPTATGFEGETELIPPADSSDSKRVGFSGSSKPERKKGAA